MRLSNQLSLFDRLELKEPGDYVEEHGRELSFDELEEMVGRLIVYDCSTQSHEWLKIVRVVEIYHYPDGHRRLIYSDGTKMHGFVDEMYFLPRYTGLFPARAYEMPDAETLDTIRVGKFKEYAG